MSSRRRDMTGHRARSNAPLGAAPTHARAATSLRDNLARDERKSMQLCKQVQHAIEDALAGFDDEVLRSLMVIRVDPAPNSGRLMVTLCPMAHLDEVNLDAVMALVEGVKGDLRMEVGFQIHRKRIPELTFRLAEAWEMAP